VIYLLSTSNKGISSVQLAKQIGVTQKTGWFIDHRIRSAMKQNKGQLFGQIEADEMGVRLCNSSPALFSFFFCLFTSRIRVF